MCEATEEMGIIHHLKNFNFKKMKPVLFSEVELGESILPDRALHVLTEETIKVKSEIWQIHKNDVDPFSSYTHNHELGIGLHLGPGEMLNVTNRKFSATLVARSFYSCAE